MIDFVNFEDLIETTIDTLFSRDISLELYISDLQSQYKKRKKEEENKIEEEQNSILSLLIEDSILQ